MDLRKQNGKKEGKKMGELCCKSCLRLSDFFFLQYSKRMMGLYIDIEREKYTELRERHRHIQSKAKGYSIDLIMTLLSE